MIVIGLNIWAFYLVKIWQIAAKKNKVHSNSRRNELIVNCWTIVNVVIFPGFIIFQDLILNLELVFSYIATIVCFINGVCSLVIGILILKALKSSFEQFYLQFKCKIAMANIIFTIPLLFGSAIGLVYIILISRNDGSEERIP